MSVKFIFILFYYFIISANSVFAQIPLGEAIRQQHKSVAASTSRGVTLPSPAEQKILKQLYHDQLTNFQHDVTKAEHFLKSGDAPPDTSLDVAQSAALGVLANALMNFDQCVVRR